MKPPSCSEVVVVGLVRNCGSTVRATVARLSRALAGFQSVRWFLVESDSSDDSVEALDRLSLSVPEFRYVSLGKLRKTHRHRVERIARCRNRYLEELENNSIYKSTDYVVMADFDGLNTRINRDAIESCWSGREWSGCFANQVGHYYDIWALRHPLWSPNDCWEVSRFMESVGESRRVSRKRGAFSRMIRISPDSSWIEVDSAFGGLAIYESSAIRGLRYTFSTVDGRGVCEHVPFNEKIGIGNGKLYINPRLINAGLTDHYAQSLIFGSFLVAVGRKLDNIRFFTRRVVSLVQRRVKASQRKSA